MKKKYLLLLVSAFVLMLSSCITPKNIAYMQDVTSAESAYKSVQAKSLTLQSGDKVLIVVHSKDPKLAGLFNLPVVGARVGMEDYGSYNSTQSTMSYTVDNDGNIDFPVLGKLHVGGMKRDEVAGMVKEKIVSQNLCNDAVVTVELDNMYFNVLGEVTRAGRYGLTKDKMTIFDAIGLAGDLTIYGQRENVKVVRNVDGEVKTYTVNLLNLNDVISSPAYYLQQDDVVYVEPNKYRQRQTTVNGNNVLSTSFWISVASLATSIAVLVIK